MIGSAQCLALLAQLHATRQTEPVPAWVVDCYDGYVLTSNPYLRPRRGGRREEVGMVSTRWELSALLDEAEAAAQRLLKAGP
jgi:hypothetical protein